MVRLQGEVPGSDFIPAPKMRSRRFPVKSMFIGVVARPQPAKGFNGRIHLERISEQVKVTKRTAHHRFTDDRLINSELKNENWRNLYLIDSDITTRQLAEEIGVVYDLERAIVDRLEFCYTTFIGDSGNSKLVAFKDDQRLSGFRRIDRDITVPPVPITVEDVTLRVRMKLGDVVERDCSCDSTYMLKAMDRVGESVRRKFSWVPSEEKCYIVMDNAGGHGTDNAITTYTNLLRDKYNIEIIHQVPRSPYCNLLDLGVWCSLQAHVEKEHYLKRTDVNALVNTVKKVWDLRCNSSGLDGVITRVWGRLRNVLALIVEGKGGNDLVEQKRGKKFRNLDLNQELLAQNQAEIAIPAETSNTVTSTNDPALYDLTVDNLDSDNEDY